MLKITLNIFDETKSKMAVIPDGDKERQLGSALSRKAKEVKKFSYKAGDFNPRDKRSYYSGRAYMAGK